MAIKKISTVHWITKAAAIRNIGCDHNSFEKYDRLGFFESQELPKPMQRSTKLYSVSSVKRFAFYYRGRRGAVEKYMLAILASGLYHKGAIPAHFHSENKITKKRLAVYHKSKKADKKED